MFKPSTDSESLSASTKNFFYFGFVFFCGWHHNGACFHPFGQVHLALGANQTSQFFGSILFGNWAMIQVFRALDWFLAYLQANVGWKTQFLKKIRTLYETYDLPSQGKLWPTITQQLIELKSCSRLANSCSLEQKEFFWGLGLLVRDVMIGVGFAFSNDIIGRSNKPISWLRVLFESRS